MRLGEKIPVPQLSAPQAARLQQRVLARVAAEPEIRPGWFGNRLRFAIAAVAVAGVALAVAVNAKGAFDGRGGLVAGANPMITELATGADSVTVKLGDASVTLAPETAASIIRRSSGAIDIALDRGRVDCEVDHIAGRAPFRVGADDVKVEVVGTVFAVELAPQAPPEGAASHRQSRFYVRVEVDRGVVAVRSPNGEFRVEAGKMWTASDGVVAMVAAVEPELIVDGDNGDNSGDRGTRGDNAARDGSSGDPAAGDGSSTGATRPQSRDGDRPDRASSNRPLQNRRPKPPTNTSRQAPPRHRAPDDARLLAAMALESSDPRAAVREYYSIATHSRGAVASFALYSKAYVEYFKLRDKSAAAETLEFFKRRFRRAREAQSALWLHALALCDLGRAGECRAAAYTYLRRFPEGKFAAAATVVVNQD